MPYQVITATARVPYSPPMYHSSRPRAAPEPDEVAHYAAGRLEVPADSFETAKQVGTVIRGICDKVCPWSAHHYTYIHWKSRSPASPDQVSDEDGLYPIKAYKHSLGHVPLPLAHDGIYTFVPDGGYKLVHWTFKVETVAEGSAEYEVYESLTSVWTHLGIDIAHTPYVSDEAFAAYRKRLHDDYIRRCNASQKVSERDKKEYYDRLDRAAWQEDWDSRW